MLEKYYPPTLQSLRVTLSLIPVNVLPWIVDKHLQYLDDKFHKIDPLTDYLANCEDVEEDRKEFIEFVENWTIQNNINLVQYLAEYASRFHSVRAKVEKLCDRVLNDVTLIKSKEQLVEYWHNFTYINEIDSLHGMFLTSGRWYVNVMLPPVKELVYCSLPNSVDNKHRNEIAYHVARRVITPNYASVPDYYKPEYEKQFASIFIPILQYYDRKILFLFDLMSGFSYQEGMTPTDFVKNVQDNKPLYEQLLDMGVYPPFGWHELRSSRKRRRATLSYEEATRPLLAKISEKYIERAKLALEVFNVFKEYEINYNNYNYKGRFCVVSKYLYWQVSEMMNEIIRERFLDAILLDKFYVALDIIKIAFEK